jgi:protein-S-isoprenylcysteine O-methyltransferase Ste14
MFAPHPQDVEGIFALGFFFGLIIFVCFEAVQVARGRGRIHLAGIGRAGLEVLILSPAIVLVIFLLMKLSDRFDLDWVEQNVFLKIVLIPVLALIWASWTHYRALHITRERKRVHKVT